MTTGHSQAWDTDASIGKVVFMPRDGAAGELDGLLHDLRQVSPESRKYMPTHAVAGAASGTHLVSGDDDRACPAGCRARYARRMRTAMELAGVALVADGSC
jgi:hypothetical protein